MLLCRHNISYNYPTIRIKKMQWLQAHFTDKLWMIQVFGVIFVTLIIRLIEGRLFSFLHKKFQQTKYMWDDALVSALHKPLAWLIWFAGVLYAADLIRMTVESPAIFDFIPSVRNIAFAGLFVWFTVRYIQDLEKRLIAGHKGRKAGDPTTVHAISQVLRATIIITTTLVVLQSIGVPIAGVMAFGGVGAFAVGYSAKDMVANYFGTLMIYMDKPFKVGDWISSPDKNIEGTVEYIGWRLTRIRTFDKRPLYVPNSLFSTIPVCNPSRMTNRRIKTNIGLRYDDATKVAGVLKDVAKMLRNHPEIDTNQTLMVYLIEFGASSLTFMVYTFTKTTEWVKFQAIQQDVFLKILEIIDLHGAQCAFPTTTLHVPEGVELKEALPTP